MIGFGLSCEFFPINVSIISRNVQSAPGLICSVPVNMFHWRGLSSVLILYKVVKYVHNVELLKRKSWAQSRNK